MILTGGAIVPTNAAGISLTVGTVAEYHRPYIGAWIGKPGTASPRRYSSNAQQKREVAERSPHLLAQVRPQAQATR